MLIQYITETREGGLEGREAAEEVSDLQTLYRASKKRFDEDDDFKTRAREAVRELQGGNPAYVQVRCHLWYTLDPSSGKMRLAEIRHQKRACSVFQLVHCRMPAVAQVQAI